MEPLAAFVFLGIPGAGILAGLLVGIGILCRWTRTDPPESHYIAARMRALRERREDPRWRRELDALKLPYRHTIC